MKQIKLMERAGLELPVESGLLQPAVYVELSSMLETNSALHQIAEGLDYDNLHAIRAFIANPTGILTIYDQSERAKEIFDTMTPNFIAEETLPRSRGTRNDLTQRLIRLPSGARVAVQRLAHEHLYNGVWEDHIYYFPEEAGDFEAE